MTAERLRDVGYRNLVTTSGLLEHEFTRVYFIPGRDDDAQILAAVVGLPATRVLPLPIEPLITGDFYIELLLLVGDDWQDVTNLELEIVR